MRRYFATKEEAALCYSRLRASCVGKEALEAEATAGERLVLLGVLGRSRSDVDMTAEAALAAAETEGLPLVRAATTTGYRAVSTHSHANKSRPSDYSWTGLASWSSALPAVLSVAPFQGSSAGGGRTEAGLFLERWVSLPSNPDSFQTKSPLRSVPRPPHLSAAGILLRSKRLL